MMKRKKLVLAGLVAVVAGMLALGGVVDDKLINSRGSIFLNFDVDNNDVNEVLEISTDAGTSPIVTVQENGFVGIGTVTPLTDLHVRSADVGVTSGMIGNADVVIESTDAQLFLFSDNNGSSGSAISLREIDNAGDLFDAWSISRNTSGAGSDLRISHSDGEVMRLLPEGYVGIGTTDPTHMLTLRDENHQLAIIDSSSEKKWTMTSAWDTGIGLYEDATTSRFMIQAGGNVGIGTVVPSERLEVAGDVKIVSDSDVTTTIGTGALVIHDLAATTGVHIDSNEIQLIGSVGATLFINRDNLSNTRINDLLHIRTNGNVGIGVSSPSTKLHVNGTTTTDVLQITGADVAEKFPVSEPVTPGMVVAIDADHPGRLCLARGGYNRRVAGVVSGANGLPAGAILGNLPGQEDAPPVALSGRVWVYCDASIAAVEPGDLLTTSDTPGHGMKVTDFGRAQGAILGKAMTGLQDGRGLVLVLVTLQ